MPKTPVICATCHTAITPDTATPGYGIDPQGEKHCFACCAGRDKQAMITQGTYTLYLTTVIEGSPKQGLFTKCKVTNWPGTLVFQGICWTNNHNWGLTRYNVRFVGPDQKVWYGVSIGDNTQLCHCRRTKLSDIAAP